VVLPDQFADTEPCRKAYATLKEGVAAVITHRRHGRFARLWDYVSGEWVEVIDLGGHDATSDPPDPN
jgi:hypothetical protein